MTDDEPILAGVRPHGLDQDAVTAYDVAVDLLNQVIGIYTARIGATPDAAAVAELREAQARYAALRRALRPENQDEVARVRQECAQIIREHEGKP